MVRAANGDPARTATSPEPADERAGDRGDDRGARARSRGDRGLERGRRRDGAARRSRRSTSRSAGSRRSATAAGGSGPRICPRAFWAGIRAGLASTRSTSSGRATGRCPCAAGAAPSDPGPGTSGAGFSSIISDGWAGYPDRLHPEEGFVHEWLHQVESVLRTPGRRPGRPAGPARRRRPDLVPLDRAAALRPDVPGPPSGDRHLAAVVSRPDDRHHPRPRSGEPPCLGLRPEHWARAVPGR